jgi:hypothetical protein
MTLRGVDLERHGVLVDRGHIVGVCEPVAVVQRAGVIGDHDPVKHVLLGDGQDVCDGADLLPV